MQRLRKLWKWILLTLCIVMVLGYVVRYHAMTKPWFWTLQIRAYESRDRLKKPLPHKILFVGSSSIRYWKTLRQDMAPLPVLNRGFGGAHIAHVTYFAKRIVLPYKPRLIVFYAGDNDIAAGEATQTLLQDLQAFWNLVQRHLPRAQLFVLSVKPSRFRWRLWIKMKAYNEAVARYAKTQPKMHYIDIATPMLHKGGKPSQDLFRWDRLHMSPKGYALWTKTINPVLVKAWASLLRIGTPSTKPRSFGVNGRKLRSGGAQR